MKIEVKKINNILLQGSDFIYDIDIDKKVKKRLSFCICYRR